MQGREAGVQGVARPALLKAARVVRCNTTAAVPSRPGVVSRHAIVCNAIVEPQQAAPAKVGVCVGVGILGFLMQVAVCAVCVFVFAALAAHFKMRLNPRP